MMWRTTAEPMNPSPPVDQDFHGVVLEEYPPRAKRGEVPRGAEGSCSGMARQYDPPPTATPHAWAWEGQAGQ